MLTMAETKDYALVKNGKVVNRIVADASFIETIRGQYDYVTDAPEAQRGKLWDGKMFTDAPVESILEPTPKKTIEDVLTKLAELETKINTIDAKVTAAHTGKTP